MGTFEATGQACPSVCRQTDRHEIAVSALSARYINAGLAWRRDERPRHDGGHQADGVALGRRSPELIEVELTPKRAPWYASIFTAYRDRLDRSEADGVAYLLNEDSGRAVRAALEVTPQGRGIAGRVAELHIR